MRKKKEIKKENNNKKNKKIYIFIGIILMALLAAFYSGKKAKDLEKEYTDYNPIEGVVVDATKKAINVSCNKEECKSFGDNLIFTLKKPLRNDYKLGDTIYIEVNGEEARETYSKEEITTTINNLSNIRIASYIFIVFFIGGFIVFRKKIIAAMIPGILWITVLYLLTGDNIPGYRVVLCILLLFPGSILTEIIAMKEK